MKEEDYLKYVKKDNPVIVQIGSHDGVVGEEYGLMEYLDTLQNFTLYLVEPIKKYFNKLYDVYGKFGDKVVYCNYAISDINGNLKMVDIGGMSKISSNGSINVESKTFKTFKSINNIEKIDFLLLDCEGYEYNILKQINFKELPVDLIRYEFYWIPNKVECDNFLISNGYNISYCAHDKKWNKIAYRG